MTARKPPILREGGLTGRVYIITSYTDKFDADGNYVNTVANTKFDVTDQFNAICARHFVKPSKP